MLRLTVLMGAPGSGKSTYAKRSGANVVTTDGVRERAQTRADTLHDAYRQINQHLAAGRDVVFDTTGSNPAVRKAAVGIARKHGAQVDAHVLDTPLQQCLDTQRGRSCPVSEADVRRVHAAVPRSAAQLKQEGFAHVRVTRDRK
jgi:predicted kinase